MKKHLTKILSIAAAAFIISLAWQLVETKNELVAANEQFELVMDREATEEEFYSFLKAPNKNAVGFTEAFQMYHEENAVRVKEEIQKMKEEPNAFESGTFKEKYISLILQEDARLNKIISDYQKEHAKELGLDKNK